MNISFKKNMQRTEQNKKLKLTHVVARVFAIEKANQYCDDTNSIDSIYRRMWDDYIKLDSWTISPGGLRV